MAGVAAVATGGTLRLDQPVLVEAAQESLGGTQHVRGPAHGVAGVVLIVELVAVEPVGRACQVVCVSRSKSGLGQVVVEAFWVVQGEGAEGLVPALDGGAFDEAGGCSALVGR